MEASALAAVRPHQAASLVHAALKRAGNNAKELVDAIRRAPETHRSAVCFLVIWMPARDLTELTADFILAHVAAVMAARRHAPWSEQIPDAVFEDGGFIYVFDSTTPTYLRRHHHFVARCLVRYSSVLLRQRNTRAVESRIPRALRRFP